MDEALRSGLLGGQRFELPNRLVEFPLLRHPPRFGNRRLLRYRLLRLRSFDLLLRLRFSPRLCSAKSDGSEHRRLSEDRPKQPGCLCPDFHPCTKVSKRSEEHTSELQSR